MTEKFAVVFPGQGSQSQGMLADFYANFTEFKQVLEESSDALGYDLWQLILNDAKKINETKYTQPALLAVSVGLWNVWLSEVGKKPVYFAGHSLGEYTALVAAESIKLMDAIRLVAFRGEIMQSSASGAMAAIIGLADDKVLEVCDKQQGYVAIANYNSPGQIVIAGDTSAVEQAMIDAKAMGAKLTVKLPVSVPSHCKLMQDAADKLDEHLKSVEILAPKTPVLHNVDVSSYIAKEDICSALVKQLHNPVRWTDTINHLVKQEVLEIIECGPGKVLTGLNKRIAKNLQHRVISTPEGLKEYTC